jgi:hypothetical protein
MIAQLAGGEFDIPHVIQLAVAPVFLLSGVGVTLGVLVNRLGRIIDRARTLEEALPVTTGTTHEVAAAELHTLSRRAALVNRAITLCTACALLICLLIAGLFIGAILGLGLTALLAGLFILAMVALIGGYLSFLREVFLATESLRFGARRH